MKKMLALVLLFGLLGSFAELKNAVYGQGNKTDQYSFFSAIYDQYPELKGEKFERGNALRAVGNQLVLKNGDLISMIGVQTIGGAYDDKLNGEMADKEVYMFRDPKSHAPGDQRFVFVNGQVEMANIKVIRLGFAFASKASANYLYRPTFQKWENFAKDNRFGYWSDSK